MEFKVGDKVRIISKKDGDEYTTYGFEVGKEYEVRAINGDRICICKENGTTGFISIYNVKLTQKYLFTKSDLQDGDIVTYRDGRKRIKKGDRFVDSKKISTFMLLCDYTNDLKDNLGDTEYDIVKVERPVKYETVYERTEEEKKEILDKVEKNYLTNVIKPFKKRFKGISKIESPMFPAEKEFLQIQLNNDEIILPYFEKGTMYKEMELNKRYTLEELGI